MTPVRCPKCGRLLGYFRGQGEIICPRCRRDMKVYFDTARHLIRTVEQERF